MFSLYQCKKYEIIETDKGKFRKYKTKTGTIYSDHDVDINKLEWRGTKKHKWDKKKDLTFQILEVETNDDDENDDDDSEEEESESDSLQDPDDEKMNGKYLIQLFGITENGISICLNVKNFTPFFFLKVPKYGWKKSYCKKIMKFLEQRIGYRYPNNPVSVKEFKRIDFYYFTNSLEQTFIRIVFTNFGAFNFCKSLFNRPLSIPGLFSGKEVYFKQYETNIDPFLRFCHIQDISPAGWITINSDHLKWDDDIRSNVQVEACVDWTKVKPIEKDMIAPFTVASFDIECKSEDKVSMPVAKTEEGEFTNDLVIQIGTTVRKFGEKECFLKHMITLKDADPLPGVIMECYEEESEVLLAWTRMIQRLDPDIITGYNIYGFDYEYIYHRAEKYDIEDEFGMLGRIRDDISELEIKKLSSSALGDNIMKILPMKGRVSIDLFKVINRDYNLSSYKLNSVAEHFMGQKKVDLPPKKIFEYQDIDSAHRSEIANYCRQDCELCNNLMDKLDIVPNNIAMANVCSVPFTFIFHRGQGIKIFSLVAKQCRKDGFLIPVVKKDKDKPNTGGYEGACVLPPKKGIYLEDAVSVLDYASLYPSSMIAENLSHDTLVQIGGPYDNLPGFEYVNVKYTVGDFDVVNRYEQFPNGKKGVLPRILMNLLKARKDTRARIKTEPDAFKRSTLNGQQLAYKITANSLYGQCGASTSPIFIKEVAASTTAVGRQMLHFAKDFVLENYKGAEIVYGDTDSIFVNFNPKDENGKPYKGKEALKKSIEIAEDVEKILTLISKPQYLEYEKTFWPFILFSKKDMLVIFTNLILLNLNKKVWELF